MRKQAAYQDSASVRRAGAPQLIAYVMLYRLLLTRVYCAAERRAAVRVQCDRPCLCKAQPCCR